MIGTFENFSVVPLLNWSNITFIMYDSICVTNVNVAGSISLNIFIYMGWCEESLRFNINRFLEPTSTWINKRKRGRNHGRARTETLSWLFPSVSTRRVHVCNTFWSIPILLKIHVQGKDANILMLNSNGINNYELTLLEDLANRAFRLSILTFIRSRLFFSISGLRNWKIRKYKYYIFQKLENIIRYILQILENTKIRYYKKSRKKNIAHILWKIYIALISKNIQHGLKIIKNELFIKRFCWWVSTGT